MYVCASGTASRISGPLHITATPSLFLPRATDPWKFAAAFMMTPTLFPDPIIAGDSTIASYFLRHLRAIQHPWVGGAILNPGGNQGMVQSGDWR